MIPWYCEIFKSLSAGILMGCGKYYTNNFLFCLYFTVHVQYPAFILICKNVIVHRNWKESCFYLQWTNLYIRFARMLKAGCSPLNLLHWLPRLGFRTNQCTAFLGLLVFSALILLSSKWVKLQKVSAALSPFQPLQSKLAKSNCTPVKSEFSWQTLPNLWGTDLGFFLPLSSYLL